MVRKDVHDFWLNKTKCPKEREREENVSNVERLQRAADGTEMRAGTQVCGLVNFKCNTLYLTG